MKRPTLDDLTTKEHERPKQNAIEKESSKEDSSTKEICTHRPVGGFYYSFQVWSPTDDLDNFTAYSNDCYREIGTVNHGHFPKDPLIFNELEDVYKSLQLSRDDLNELPVPINQIVFVCPCKICEKRRLILIEACQHHIHLLHNGTSKFMHNIPLHYLGCYLSDGSDVKKKLEKHWDYVHEKCRDINKEEGKQACYFNDCALEFDLSNKEALREHLYLEHSTRICLNFVAYNGQNMMCNLLEFCHLYFRVVLYSYWSRHGIDWEDFVTGAAWKKILEKVNDEREAGKIARKFKPKSQIITMAILYAKHFIRSEQILKDPGIKDVGNVLKFLKTIENLHSTRTVPPKSRK